MPLFLFKTMPYVTVDVHVDLDDFDDDDLIGECQKRGLSVESDCGDEITEMFYAFKLGRTERAVELARKVAQDHVGMILP